MTVYNTTTEDEKGRQFHPVLFNSVADGSGTWYFAIVDSDGHLQIDALSITAGSNRIGTVSGVGATVRVTKAIAAATDYTAEDVVAETGTATPWGFTAIFRANAAGGYITKAQALWKTTALTARLTLYLFNVTPPTCALNDNAANTAPHNTDKASYLGKIDFPALEDLGTGMSTAVATPSTTGNLPLWVVGAAAADDLYGVLVTRDAITTEVAADELSIELTVEQY